MRRHGPDAAQKYRRLHGSSGKESGSFSFMSDVNAPLPYSETHEPSSSREGGIGLLILLALGLAIGGVALAMVNREAAEPFVLAILAPAPG